MGSKLQKAHKPLGLFTLVMMTIISVDSLRNLPVTALFGTSLVFFFLLAGGCFLLPCAFVSAELASSWPQQGGIYVWVKKALGPKWGLLAIWLQWVENVIWYPTLLSFVCGTLGYLIDANFSQHNGYLFLMIVIIFWSITLLNLRGISLSARLTELCSIVGLIFPMVCIIALGLAWVIMHRPIYIHFTWPDFFSHFHHKSLWVSLTGVVLSLCGIELATVHAKDVENPKKTFPRALIISTGIILLTLILGSLAIAMVVPNHSLSLVTGIMQAFDIFLTAYHQHQWLPVLGMMLVLGGIGSVNNWMIAPAKGLLIAANDFSILHQFAKENKKGAPTTILILQAVVVSLLTSIFLWVHSVNASYWLLTVLASDLYMLMYILMFISALCLRYRYPRKSGDFQVPGKKWGIWLWSSLGLFTCIVTLAVGFIRPNTSSISLGSYCAWIMTGIVVMIIPPFLICRFSGKSLKREGEQYA